MTTDSKNTLQKLGGRGRRLTKARKAIVEILTDAGRPLAAREVSATMNRTGMRADKSTIYRQLSFLEKQQVVRAVQFDERQRRYEMAEKAHHHHLVCVGCRSVKAVPCREELVNQEEHMLREMNFKVLKHSLEFFGLCAKCRAS